MTYGELKELLNKLTEEELEDPVALYIVNSDIDDEYEDDQIFILHEDVGTICREDGLVMLKFEIKEDD